MSDAHNGVIVVATSAAAATAAAADLVVMVVVEEEEEKGEEEGKEEALVLLLQARDNRLNAFSICPKPSSAYFLTNTHSASSALNTLRPPFRFPPSSSPPPSPLPPPPATTREARAEACEWAVARLTRCFHTNINLRVSPYT